MRETPKAEIDRRVNEVGANARVGGAARPAPAALSGGQRQRVAMGRAIVREPEAFLMDEPLSNLDAKLRVDMRAELSRLHERLGITTIYVTHDQVEAMTLGTRVAVMRDGTIQQVDTPQALYHEPVNLFVAAFIGSPAMNFVKADLNGRRAWSSPASPRRCRRPATGRPDSGRVILGIRPQDFADARTRRSAGWRRSRSRSRRRGARLRDARPLPDRRAAGRRRRGARGERRRRARGLLAPTGARSSPPRSTRARRCDRASDARSRWTRARLHFFDPETSETLRGRTLTAV